VTLRSPTSAYTFLSFLHSFTPSRLLSFISLANFAPTRVEFSQYLSWCATKVAASLESTGCGSIAYGEECLSIAAVLPSEDGEGDIELLRVTSRQADGSIIHRLARNILFSTGGAPFVPPLLRSEELKSKVVHSSEFLGRGKELLAQIGSVQGRTKKVAVCGAGQSACEIFMALASADSLVSSGGAERTQVDLLIHRGALRPADDSPFSNEVFDPGMSQAIYRLEDEGRAQVMKEARGTNYSVANATTLDAVRRVLPLLSFTDVGFADLRTHVRRTSLSLPHRSCPRHSTVHLHHIRLSRPQRHLQRPPPTPQLYHFFNSNRRIRCHLLRNRLRATRMERPSLPLPARPRRRRRIPASPTTLRQILSRHDDFQFDFRGRPLRILPLYLPLFSIHSTYFTTLFVLRPNQLISPQDVNE
jgi:hypothetical protein